MKIGLRAIGLSAFLFFSSAWAGGDLPFPFTGGEDDPIQLAQVWNAKQQNVQVLIYKSESGETYILIKDNKTGEIEILTRVN